MKVFYTIIMCMLASIMCAPPIWRKNYTEWQEMTDIPETDEDDEFLQIVDKFYEQYVRYHNDDWIKDQLLFTNPELRDKRRSRFQDMLFKEINNARIITKVKSGEISSEQAFELAKDVDKELATINQDGGFAATTLRKQPFAMDDMEDAIHHMMLLDLLGVRRNEEEAKKYYDWHKDNLQKYGYDYTTGSTNREGKLSELSDI